MVRRLVEWFFYALPLGLMLPLSLPQRYLEVPYTRLLWHHDGGGPDLSTRDVPLEDFPEFRNRQFLYQSNLFFFDRTGDTRYHLIFDPLTLAQVSVRNYLSYPKVGKQITLWSDSGERQWNLDTLGYPVLSPSGNRFFVASSDSQLVSLYDFNRNPLVTNLAIGSLLTDWFYAIGNDDLILGTLDGEIITFDYRGHVMIRERIEGSRVTYVKSVGISSRGARVAALSGLYPERLTVWDRDGRRLWSVDTGFNRRERQSLVLDEENHLLLEQVPGGIRVRDLESGHIRHLIAMSGAPGEMEDYLRGSSVKGACLVASVAEKQRMIYLLDPEGRMVWKRPITDRHIQYVELLADRRHLLVAGSDTVYAFRLFQYQ